MAGCEGWVYDKGRQGTPLRGHRCGKRAVVQVPEGMDLRAGAWFCEYHAPTRLLPEKQRAHGIGTLGGISTSKGGEA